MGKLVLKRQRVYTYRVIVNCTLIKVTDPFKLLAKRSSLHIKYVEIVFGKHETSLYVYSLVKVHFSEIDQVKLMSQESLASMAASEGYEPTILNSLPTSIQCPSVAKVVNNKMLAKQEELEKAMGDNLSDFTVRK